MFEAFSKYNNPIQVYWGTNLTTLFLYNDEVITLFSVGDKEADLEAGLRQLQHFYLDLEKFLNWLTEAETTATNNTGH